VRIPLKLGLMAMGVEPISRGGFCHLVGTCGVADLTSHKLPDVLDLILTSTGTRIPAICFLQLLLEPMLTPCRVQV